MICRECEYKSSVLIDEGFNPNPGEPSRKTLHIVCTKLETMRITEQGETWFTTMRETKNTGIQPYWCPLRED
jgi:hypothetical protein